jgi:hypothetical protein
MPKALLGISHAVRARPGLFAGVAFAVVALDLLLPIAVLSLARKPWDYAAFNAWLPNLPAYLVSDAPLGRKLDFLWDVALVWFMADGPYGAPEWGFTISVGDVVRVLVLALLFGAYFALWTEGRAAGVAGAAASVLGLSTSPCSVVGCGAPVLPVVGLAFEGLSSGTLALLAGVSRWTTAAVTLALVFAVLHLGRRVGASLARAPAPGTPGVDPRAAARRARPSCR